MKLLTVVGLWCLFTLISCGGGGGGASNHLPGRTHELTYQHNSTQKVTDSGGTEVIIEPGALVAPQAVPVTVRFTENWPDRPASPVIETRNLVLCETSTDSGAGSITMRYPYAQEDPQELLGVTSEDGLQWRPLPTAVESVNRRIAVTYTYEPPDDSRTGSVRGVKRLIRIGIARVPYKSQPISSTIKLVRLHGNGLDDHIDSSDSCVIIHGMNNTVDDIRPLGESLFNKQVFKHVYALTYDWRKSIKENGRAIAAHLKQQMKPGVKTTLIGYSLGGLVASWIVEREVTHDLIRALVMVATPRQGTKIAAEESRCEGQKHDSLNDSKDTPAHWGNLCDLAMPAAKDVIPGSAFLNELNGSAINHRTSVPYLLIAGDKGNWGYGAGNYLCRKHYGSASCDGLVPADSLLGFNYPQHEIHGAVVKRIVHYNHAQIIKDATAQQLIANELKTLLGTPSPKLSITPLDMRAHDEGWDIRYTLTNQGVIPLTTSSMCFPTCDAYGEWTTTQWYADNVPNGQFLPTAYTAWAKTLAPGQSFSFTGRLAFDYEKRTYDKTDTSNHSKTVMVVCEGAWSNNRAFTSSATITLADKEGNTAQPPRRGAVLTRENGKPLLSIR